MASDSLGRFRFLSGVFVEETEWPEWEWPEWDVWWAKGLEDEDEEVGMIGVPGVNEEEKRAMVDESRGCL